MLYSILTKAGQALLSLGLITVLLFALSKAVPSDPVEKALNINIEGESTINYQQEYERKKRQLKLDLPLFYLSVLPSNFPKNLSESGTLADIRERRKALFAESEAWIPSFHWHGAKNQFHHWLFGKKVSLEDAKPVWQKISRALVWTLFFVMVSIFFSYFLGIAIGTFLGSTQKKRLKTLIETSLFSLYAIPVFWMATLLLVFFTTKEYGAWTNIFPSVGLAPIDLGESWYKRILDYGGQLVLPCFVLVLHNLAFLSMLTKRNIELYKNLPFTTTSKAYGFSNNEILFKEVLPMSLIPMITSITSSIPAAISGSLIIEIIFNIPGMGRLLYRSILSYDWPVVFQIVLLIAMVTFICFLLADLLYKLVDPRIR